jgi:hypothetical protein
MHRWFLCVVCLCEVRGYHDFQNPERTVYRDGLPFMLAQEDIARYGRRAVEMVLNRDA